MNAAIHKWRERGLDVELDNLGFPGERNDVASYLEDRGWRAVRTQLNELLTDNGLPLQSSDADAPFGKNYYCTAVLHKPG